MSATRTDIGHGVSIEPFGCEHQDVGGYFIRYSPKFGDVGSIRICQECSGPTWEIVQLEPLTISPSIRTVCGDKEYHGFIREGKWVPA